MTDHTFPTGAELISALIDLHKETDDEGVIELIEAEMAVAASDPEVKDISRDPLCIPNVIDWMVTFYDSMSEESQQRFVRLRLFQELGAFEEQPTDRDTNPDNLPATLTQSEIQYLGSIGIEFVE